MNQSNAMQKKFLRLVWTILENKMVDELASPEHVEPIQTIKKNVDRYHQSNHKQQFYHLFTILVPLNLISTKKNATTK